jgi:hypothetical protein
MTMEGDVHGSTFYPFACTSHIHTREVFMVLAVG